MKTYTVDDSGELRVGTAQDILQSIRDKQTGNEEISALTVDGYADALIQNADYYLSKGVIDVIRRRPFDTKFDKALTFLNAMPASGAHIIAQEDN
jgi:hypothetical protein